MVKLPKLRLLRTRVLEVLREDLNLTGTKTVANWRWVRVHLSRWPSDL